MNATTDLAERLARADATLWIEWMEAVRSLPNNPYGIDIQLQDDLVMLHAHAAPLPYYNRVFGVSDEIGHLLDDVIAFYTERFTPCRIDLNPFRSGADVLGALNDRDFHPAEFQTNLYMEPIVVEPIVVPSVHVRVVRNNELDFFCDLYERAYYGPDSPRRLADFRADTIKARFGRKGWTFYLCVVDGVPSGGSVLFIKDGVASLAGGATMDTLRGRGCQKALLNRRLLDAQAAGCEIAVSRCGVGTPSQRNMERTGLRTAYTKSIWQLRALALL